MFSLKTHWPAFGLILVLGGLGWIFWQIGTTSAQLRTLENELARVHAELTQATSSAPATAFAPAVAPAIVPAYPNFFADHRLSPTLAIVKRRHPKTSDEQIVAPEQIVGNAVSLTVDGWLATDLSALNGLRLADLGVRWQGRVYAIVSAVHDRSTGGVFLKIHVNDLPVAAFARSDDIVSGMPVWTELETQRFYPHTLVDTGFEGTPNRLSSDVASRRYLLSGLAETPVPGSPVWNQAGLFVGLLEGRVAGGWLILPAEDLNTALNSLLNSGEIHRASLGVNGLDTARVSWDAPLPGVPATGFWLRAETRTHTPAIVAHGPAAGILQENDVLNRIDHDILDGSVDPGSLLLQYKPNADVLISGQRNGQALSTHVVLGDRVTSEPLK